MRRCVYITLHNPNCRVRAARLRVPGRCGTKPPQPNTVADAFFFRRRCTAGFCAIMEKTGAFGAPVNGPGTGAAGGKLYDGL